MIFLEDSQDFKKKTINLPPSYKGEWTIIKDLYNYKKKKNWKQFDSNRFNSLPVA